MQYDSRGEIFFEMFNKRKKGNKTMSGKVEVFLVNSIIKIGTYRANLMVKMY